MKNKLKRFADLKTFSNVLEPTDDKVIDWKKVFGNDNPITLELACGKGDYTLALAKIFPKRNFIGIDIKGARLWKGAKIALAENLTNVAFLRIQIENLERYFEQDLNPQNIFLGIKPIAITTIWIVFPDPFPRKRQINKRLTSPRFLNMYKNILSPNGTVHLKTDDLNLLNYSVETAITEGWKIKKVINNIYALYKTSPRTSAVQAERNPESRKKINEITDIQTFYENQHLKAGRQINYLKIKKPI